MQHPNDKTFDQLAAERQIQIANPQLHVIGISDFLALELPERELILSPWLPTSGLCMLHAARGVGKTHLSLGIAYAVAKGGSFLLWSAPKPRGVLFIDGEMPASALQERFANIIKMNGDSSLPGTLQIFTPDLQTQGIIPDLGTLEGQSLINNHITEYIDLIIVDNLSCLVRTGKENDSESWQPVQSWALALRSRGKSVLFVHHQGKGGNQRGSSKKEDVLDTVIALKYPDDYTSQQGARFIVKYEKSRGFYGEEAKPFEARLTADSSSKPYWQVTSIEESTYQKAISLYNEGLEQKDIALELNINKSNVSRYIKRGKEEGLIQAGRQVQ